jgi:hypothetical protein
VQLVGLSQTVVTAGGGEARVEVGVERGDCGRV